MRIVHRLTAGATCLAAVASSLVLTSAAGATGVDKNLCAHTAERVTIPSDFGLDACFDGKKLHIINRSDVVMEAQLTGDHGSPERFSQNAGAAELLMAAGAPLATILPPGYLVRIPVGAGELKVHMAGSETNSNYPWIRFLVGIIPIGASLDAYQAGTGLGYELQTVAAEYGQCEDRNGFIGKIGCSVNLTWDVGFSITRFAAKIGIAAIGGVVAAVVNLIETGAWAAKMPGQVIALNNAPRDILVPALSGSTGSATASPNTPGKPVVVDEIPGGFLSADADPWNVPCRGDGVLATNTVRGAKAGEAISFTSTLNGAGFPLGKPTTSARADGTFTIQWDCTSSDVGQQWTLLFRAASGREGGVYINGVAAGTPAAQQPQQPVQQPVEQPVQPSPLTFVLSENPFLCDGSSHRLGTLTGAAGGERITFSSPQVGGLLPGTANGSGELALIWQCNPGDAGQSWSVTANGQSSGRSGTFSVTGTSPAPAQQPAQPACRWSGYAQNQWAPQGAAIRDAPGGNRVGGIAGNTAIEFDRWTATGNAIYPGNPAPFNGDQWLHLADGRGWVSFPGVRAAAAPYDPNSGPGPAVSLPAGCRG